PRSDALLPYTTLFRPDGRRRASVILSEAKDLPSSIRAVLSCSGQALSEAKDRLHAVCSEQIPRRFLLRATRFGGQVAPRDDRARDRKSTRLNSSHGWI